LVTKLELERVEGLLVAPVERLPRGDALSALAVAAAAEVLQSARQLGITYDPDRTGVVVGSDGATLEIDAEFGGRILARGREHAEPRRFPGTSPNAGAGNVAIAFGLHGPSHAVGAGGGAALEALQVAGDWIAAGDADAMLVIAAEHTGLVSRAALVPHGVSQPPSGARAVLLTAGPSGPPLTRALLEAAEKLGISSEPSAGAPLWGLARAAGLPESVGFGSVRSPE
jgi:hypothetical protein